MGTLTAYRLRELLHYDKESGEFVRIKRSKDVGRGGGSVGKVAGGIDDQGYVRIMVDSVRHKAHRLAVLYMTGSMPADEVDHINGNRSDNRWVNLREATKAENMQNVRRAHANNSTGVLGVSFENDRRKWKAHICVNGRKRTIGRFTTQEAAHAAYLQAKRVMHAGCTI